MLIVNRSVLYTLCVLGTFVLDFDLFVRRRKFTCSTWELVNPTVHIFVFIIIVYFWFCKIIYSVGTAQGNLTLVRLNKLVILRNSGL
jgi:hypothetical protein